VHHPQKRNSTPISPSKKKGKPGIFKALVLILETRS
jgi:hypothetical protein